MLGGASTTQTEKQVCPATSDQCIGDLEREILAAFTKAPVENWLGRRIDGVWVVMCSNMVPGWSLLWPFSYYNGPPSSLLPGHQAVHDITGLQP